MAARRVPAGLKLLNEGRPVKPVPAASKDATLGGLGLDWDEIPLVLDEGARAAWEHLHASFADQPVRFREGDRAAVTAYALARSMHERSYTELLQDGLTVEGRSSADRGRQVKSPAFQLWRDSGTALRHWVRELALSPDSRGRTGISEDRELADDGNPFTGDNPFD
jgi:P27 family predicted phage terminase small subunit